MTDCVLDHFLVHNVDYNADGKAAQNLPYFEHITLKNTLIGGIAPALSWLDLQMKRTGKTRPTM